jgi:hypothetical protein
MQMKYREQKKGRSLAGIACSKSRGMHGSLYLASDVCFLVEVSAMGRSLV